MTVFEIGNGVESTRHSRPPLWMRWGGLCEQLVLVRQGRQLPPLERDRRLLRRHRPAGEVDLVLGEAVEGRLGEAEVLRQERLGGVADPVGDAERAELGEVAVVEDQDEVGRLVAQAFEHVAVAAGEVPDVARLEVVGLGVPLRVDDRRPDPPLDARRPTRRRWRASAARAWPRARASSAEHHRDIVDR